LRVDHENFHGDKTLSWFNKRIAGRLVGNINIEWLFTGNGQDAEIANSKADINPLYRPERNTPQHPGKSFELPHVTQGYLMLEYWQGMPVQYSKHVLLRVV